MIAVGKPLCRQNTDRLSLSVTRRDTKREEKCGTVQEKNNYPVPKTPPKQAISRKTNSCNDCWMSIPRKIEICGWEKVNNLFS